MLHEFAVMGVTEARLCASLGLNGKLDITLDHMATLAGFFTALKDGDTTIEEAFPESGGLGAPQPAERKSQQVPAPAATPVADPHLSKPNGGDSDSRPSGAEAPAGAAFPAGSNPQVGTITSSTAARPAPW
jgi:hypothetical protein